MLVQCQKCGAIIEPDDIRYYYRSPAYPSEPYCPDCGRVAVFEKVGDEDEDE